jgi:hypothetical protein
MSELVPYPGENIVGWVAYHLPRAVAFAERDIAAVRASARHFAAVYAAANRCPVGHAVSDAPNGCGYCANADRRWVEALQEAYG